MKIQKINEFQSIEDSIEVTQELKELYERFDLSKNNLMDEITNLSYIIEDLDRVYGTDISNDTINEIRYYIETLKYDLETFINKYLESYVE